MNKFFLKVFYFYQRFISITFPSCCRFYPTCSEYAIWVFKNTNFFYATFLVFFRILRCNQFSKGGIDYPLIKKTFKTPTFFTKVNYFKPVFWFIPYNTKRNKFYIIKAQKGK